MVTLSTEFLPGIAFAIGAMFQIAYLTWGHWTRRHALAMAIILPVGWIFASLEMSPGMATIAVIGAGVLATATVFRDAIIPANGIHTLFISTLPLWALVVEAGRSTSSFTVAVALLGLALMLVLLTRRAIPRPWRIAATTYAILQLVFLASLHFTWESIGFFFGGNAPGLVEAAAGGLIFSFLAAHLVQLYSILQPPATATAPKGSSEARRAHLDLLASRFQDTPFTVRRGILMLTIFGFYWGLGRIVLDVDPLSLLALWLIGSSIALSRKATGAQPSPRDPRAS